MLIGAFEIVVVAVATVIFVPMAFATNKRWLSLIPMSLLIAMFVTPADPASQILLALMAIPIYFFVERLNRSGT